MSYLHLYWEIVAERSAIITVRPDRRCMVNALQINPVMKGLRAQ
jgi:hypothetical protein